MSKGKRKRDSTVEDEDESVEQVVEEVPTSKSTRAAALAAFTGTGADLAASLQTNSLDTLRTSLTSLRNFTSRNSHDEKISPSDKRIQLAADFCRAGGIGQTASGQDNRRGLINAWDFIDAQDQTTLLPIPLFVLSNLISLLGSHQPTHDLADEVIQTLLPTLASTSNAESTQSANENYHWNRLQTYLSLSGGKSDASIKGKTLQNRGSQEVVTMASLRLLLEITTFAGGKYARSVFDNMNWTMKSLPRLLSMRRRTNTKKKAAKANSKPKNAVTLDRPDIRTLWILFLLSFLCSSTGIAQPVSLQVGVLSLGKDFLPAILKGLANDSPQIVVHILMALHAGLISDEAAVRLPRSKVAGFFSEWACKELLSLYDREADLVSVASTGERHSIADVVHHFMLALCTHPGRGICYVDQGWYGRQQQYSTINEDDDKEIQDVADGSSTAVFNKILLGLLKSLSPTRSSKQAELTLRILASSQELLSPFLQASTGSLSSASIEPRSMSIAWLSTAAFMGRILGTGLPEESKWKPLPPSLDRCIHSLLPASLTKAILIRGIQQKDRLTRHAALVLLSRVLDRLQRFKTLCLQMSFLHDDKDNGLPLEEEEVKVSTKDKEEAILRGVFSNGTDLHKPWSKMCNDVMEEARQRIPDLTVVLSSIDIDLKQKKDDLEAVVALTPSMLIIEAALRSARLHYQVFEEASTSDLGRLLSSASLSTSRDDDASEEVESSQRLSLVCRLHAIQLLTLYAQRNAGGVDLFVRQSSKDTTAFRHLLQLATSTTRDQVREASRDLVKEAMLGTILFEHNRQEWEAWQYALDKSSEVLLDFFDESVQRCLKTPYRYIEMARAVMPDLEAQDSLCASPVFFVMAEQYNFRLQSGLLEDIHAQTAFLNFVERFLPTLLVYKGLNVIRPLVALVKSKIVEVIAADDQRSINGEAKKISHECRLMLGNALKRVQRRYDLLLVDSDTPRETLLEHATKDVPKIELDGESEIVMSPTDLIWKGTRGIVPSGATVDWDMLLFSCVETKMMLYFLQILSTYDGHTTVQSLLKLTMAHGQVNTNEIVDRMCDNLNYIHLYRERCLFGLELAQAIAEAPLDLDNLGIGVDLASDLESDAVHTQIVGDDLKLRQCSEAWIKLNPILSSTFQQQILAVETHVGLFYEAASCFKPFVRLGEPKILLRLKELMQSSEESRLICNGLLMWKEFLDMGPDNRYKVHYDTPDDFNRSVLKSLLRRSDLADLDAILCKLLAVDRSLRRIFCEVLLDGGDLAGLVGHIPLSVAIAMSKEVTDENQTEEDNSARYRPLMRVCIARVFDALQTVATPLSKACLSLNELSVLTAPELHSSLQEALPARPYDAFKSSALLLAAELLRRSPTDWLETNFLQALLDKSLLWLVRRFAEDEEESAETIQGVEAFLSLLNVCSQHLDSGTSSFLKAHLVEPVLLAAVANRLGSKVHLRLIQRLIKLTHLKTSLLERLMADVVKSREATEDEANCDEVVAMVYDTIQKDAILCTADMVASLVKLYRGTLSKTDRKVMKLFHSYESKQGVSILSNLQHWEAIPKQAIGEIDLGLLSRLDPIRVHETCLKFPRSRAFEDLLASGYGKDADDANTQCAVYDPLLILASTGALLTRDEPMSGLYWLELIRTNALGVVVCCLSSRWPSTRSIAMNILAKVYIKVTSADFQEKDHLLLVLDFARNSYASDDVCDSAGPSSLPLTTTLFVAHSLRSLGIPSLYLYPLISRFMLQRPTPDPTDVPLLYNFLYSSSAQSTTAKSEKIFILRYLLACIKFGGSLEWRIMKHRHVWDSVCSLYTADSIDGNIKRIIEDIFIAVSKKPDLAFRVVVRHAWLNYILQAHLLEPQVSKERSGRFWVKCLSNLLESIDFDRMQSAKGGSFSLSQFASVLQRLADSSEDMLTELSDYNDLLQAVQALVDGKVKVNLLWVLASHQILCHQWTRTALDEDSLPIDDGGEDQQIHKGCKDRLRHIRASLREASRVTPALSSS